MGIPNAQYLEMLARTQGKAHRPNPEAGEPVELESTLHNQIIKECKNRMWIYLHGRMDMATGRTVAEPDFTILADRGRTFYIECKSKTGKVTTKQKALHAWAQNLGHTVHLVVNLEQFLEVIK